MCLLTTTFERAFLTACFSEGERLSNVLFDYSLVLENAAELHLMDSAFALLADALGINVCIYV